MNKLFPTLCIHISGMLVLFSFVIDAAINMFVTTVTCDQ